MTPPNTTFVQLNEIKEDIKDLDNKVDAHTNDDAERFSDIKDVVNDVKVDVAVVKTQVENTHEAVVEIKETLKEQSKAKEQERKDVQVKKDKRRELMFKWGWKVIGVAVLLFGGSELAPFVVKLFGA